ncbi:TfoX/Sxy family protein [Auraticoccus monumenti]|uniref:TfoX N-terminal domain-containing protein n=1 Tax=Auraticoccus monumenti TaxID=675864 RepID=A0A1G6WMK4_9ACTN|nr:TfoX/Sxy family protein [Auraticoccus monumenti]SDD67078.1 TfoX N-terminal domain-containing protein [Auraticoccus monumenti]
MTDPVHPTSTGPGAQDVLAQRVRDLVPAGREVREVRMFGGLSFMVDERMAVAAGRDGSLLVRTDAGRHEELLGRGAQPATMGPDRPMGRGWLTVPAPLVDDDRELGFWIQVGIDSRDAPASP